MDAIEIIFEDENILAINKPSGLVVHSDGRTQEETLDDWLKINFPDLENVGNPHTLDSGRYIARWGIVNRLDRDTSGIILIAKDEVSFLNLQKQFVERTVEKEYAALVHGKIDFDKLKITEPISRHKKDPRIWVVGTGVGERQTKRDAETDIDFISFREKENTSLLKLFPKTGRTHQLRLHCRFIGHPIVGDIKYGINGIANEHGTEQITSTLALLQKEGNSAIEQDKNSRLMLHAKSLEILHPITGQKIKIETDLPENFV